MAEPVFSLEAEQALLGGILVSPVAFSEVADRVSAEDFYTTKHKTAFLAMEALAYSNTPIDIMTIADRLEADGNLGDGDWAYLATLVRDTPSAANVIAYADIVRGKAKRRRLVAIGLELQAWAREGDAETALSRLSDALSAAGADSPTSARLMKDFLPQLIEGIDKAASGITSASPPIPTGLPDLDALLDGGIRAGQLVVVAGRPAMGKSVLGMQIASRVAREQRAHTLVFSLEMTGGSLAQREIAARGTIPLSTLRTGALDEGQWARLSSASAVISEARIWIDETPSLSLPTLQARARRMHRQHPLGAVIVDHIGLMCADGRPENRQQEVSKIARELKGLAKELKCPVIALSQLNRGLEQRQNKRPMPSDLRESGEIEQSADVIISIYRDEVYNPESLDRGCAELIVGKNRDGRIGTVPVAFLGEISTFATLSGPLPSSAFKSAPSPRRGIEL